MSIGILATGDEIIHGDTLNTNGYEIAHLLSSGHMAVGSHLSCSDREQDIYDSIAYLAARHNILILIGGLGPTSDDRTRFALARFLNESLIEHATAIDHIETRLKRAQQELNSGNRQQGLFPADATLLANPNGTAMGCYIQRDHRIFVMLPGPPIECLTMFKDYVLPTLRESQPRTQKQLLKWRLFGASEGMISELLDNSLKSVRCETGYRLERPYLEFKVICHQGDVDIVRELVTPILAPYLIATPEQRASEHLVTLIEQLQQSIVITDEATGGLLQTLIQTPNTYPWLKFQEHPNAIWHFHLSGLSAYWQNQSDQKSTDLILECRHNQFTERETHVLPFYNQWVINAATEWAAYWIGRKVGTAS